MKLKTNKGLPEGIFIFYFFNLLLASPITETKNTKCLIRQECHNRGKQLIRNNRQTYKQTNKQELNSKTIVDGIKVNPWGISPIALISEVSRRCISTTNEKHTKY